MGTIAAALLAAAGTAGGATPPLAVELVTPDRTEAVVRLEAVDRAPLDAPHAVTAAMLFLDGKPDQEILLLPGSGRDAYEAVVGPLGPGRHRIEVRASEHWPADARLAWTGLSARAVVPGDPGHDALRFAPRLGLRGDTVGEATDLPLLMYVEEDAAEGGRRLRYTVVFSNEDGGTPARALMARWGRATDIELLYEVVLGPGGEVLAERYQGPDHEIRPFRGRRKGAHPLLVDATLNNLFRDQGRSPAVVALVPEAFGTSEATRESFMDRHPWSYRTMAKELALEGKLFPGRGQPRDQVVDDPRRYLYAEARLRLVNAAVAARAGFADGRERSSHQGDPRLVIARDGWVRTAVPLGSGVPTAVAWECLPRDPAGEPARCEIEASRAFLLGEDYRPGPSRVAPASLRLAGGESEVLKPAP